MKFWILFILGITLSGCTHSLHVSHVSDFSPTYKAYSQGQLIKARAEQFTIMGFVTETTYIEQAYNNLQANCKDGQIQGITSQYSTSHGFFSWTNVLELQGLCIKN